MGVFSDKDWWATTLVRVIRTMAQTALGMFTVGMAMPEIGWLHVASVAAVSGIYSLLTNIATPPKEMEQRAAKRALKQPTPME